MSVDIEKHLRGTVAQTVLGVFDADAVGRKAAGVIVPEFMKGDIDAGRFGQALKVFGPVARVLEFAEWVREYQVIILPGLAVGLAGGDGPGPGRAPPPRSRSRPWPNGPAGRP